MDDHLLIHLSDDDTVDATSRALLGAGQAERMPASSRTAIAAGLGISAAAASAMAAGTTTATAGIGLLAKLSLVMLAIGGLTITGYFVTREPGQEPENAGARGRSSPAQAQAPQQSVLIPSLPLEQPSSPPIVQQVPSPPVIVAAAVVTSTSNPVAPVPIQKPKLVQKLHLGKEKSNVAVTAQPPTDTVVTPSQPSNAGSGLGLEIAAIDQAQKALSAGHFAVAKDAIANYVASYPRGALRAEAAALQFDIAVAQGHTDAAITLGEAFLQRYPGSPQRHRISNKLNALQGSKSPQPGLAPH